MRTSISHPLQIAVVAAGSEEPEELTLLKVERLGEEVLRQNMSWFHLPIADVSTPDERFEQEWDVAGEELCSSCAAALTCWSIAAEGLDGPAR